MNHKITLLDLGGVVYQSTGRSNKIINWEIITQLNNKYGYDLNIGKDKFPDFMEDYNTLTHQSLSGKEFLKSIFDTLDINLALIERIKNQSDIIIVSDNYRENIDYISKRFAFDSWAIRQIYSFDYQMVKSNPKFFKKLLKELSEYDKEQMVFIDDSPSKLESAAQHGIKGILFQNNIQVFEGLKKYYFN